MKKKHTASQQLLQQQQLLLLLLLLQMTTPPTDSSKKQGVPPQTQQVALQHVAFHDFAEQVVQSRVAVGHDQGLLGRVVVVQIGDDLHRHVRFTGAGRPNHLCP